MPDLSSQLRAELDEAISQRQLDSVAKIIRDNAAECYAMVTMGEDDYATVGNTRFGGSPDLPSGMAWPTSPDNPDSYCNFIAQINFAELPSLSIETALPDRGILYLFVRYMDGAAVPVILDTLYFDGDIHTLSRRTQPASESMCDEYLVDLIPQRIQAIPAISIANYHRKFRQQVDDNAEKIDGQDGHTRRWDLLSDLNRAGQIGQMLGFANAGDERNNLYRELVLENLGKHSLFYNDYWDTMQEYEAAIEEWRHDERIASSYREMRPGVEWLMSNRDMIANLVDEWRLLFRIDSNTRMNLNINDFDPLYAFIRHEDLARRNFSNLGGRVTQG